MLETSAIASQKRIPRYAELLMALACGLAITYTALFLGVMPLVRSWAGGRDFVVYWATGQQLVHHANPYDPVAMGEIERGAGYAGKRGSYYMRNPPWALPLTYPLGFVGARAAALPWSLLMLSLLVVSVRAVWPVFGQADSHLRWLGYCFPPALQCVNMGQTSIFLLLGLALFLRLQRTRPFWAGAALALCTLKPHLFLPFGFVLLVWIVISRSYAVLFGSAAAIAFSCLITEWIDPRAWSQYAHWAAQSGISKEFIPCLSVVLRDMVDPNAGWLVFLPASLGCIWALSYFWKRRYAWDWLEDGSLVMLVSLVVAPYCWIYDQSLAMPALLYGACRSRSPRLLAALAVLYIVLVLQPFGISGGLESKVFLWPALAWLLWYIAAQASAKLTRPLLQPGFAQASSLG